MPLPESWIVTQDLAGLRAQALGLAEAAGLAPALRQPTPPGPWRLLPARLWPPAVATSGLGAAPPLLIGCGGQAAACLAALRGRQRQVVQVQHPRMRLDRFDLVVVNRHDEIAGPNVVVTRTALHRATPARLAAERALWSPRLAHLPRPLVAVLVGGSNGRFRLEAAEGTALASQLAAMLRAERMGLAVTPSRRTAATVRAALASALTPLGAFVWDMTGDNPYFGLLACADAIVVTTDSVSMISEAVATAAPVLVAPLPGRSRRIGLFVQALLAEGRVRRFTGRLEHWTAAPLDDTAAAAAAMRQRLGW
jgi:mitochondrial fission protein ELM1